MSSLLWIIFFLCPKAINRRRRSYVIYVFHGVFCKLRSRRSPSSILLYIRPLRCPRISLPVSSQNYEDMKYDQDMKIGRIAHQDNQDTSTTRRLKSTEVLLSRHGRFRPQLALRRTNRSATAGLLGNPTKRRRRQSPLVPNSLGSTTRCIRA